MLRGTPVNGAEALIRTLVDSGVEVCFGNPGTSEMHFVAALDTAPEMRPVLGLFEGVVTGAADGYGRMAGRPAATLLHLGPGLANGWANLHNARRARTPIVNVVGDHATTHKHFDAPLESDLDSLAASVQGWVRRSPSVRPCQPRSWLDLSRPNLDFVAIAEGMGVPAERATTAEELGAAVRRALREPGPHLVEVLLAPSG